MSLLRLPAPAKINLFLHINHRRPDGYHELQTLFQLLDYGDEIDFEPWQDAPDTQLVRLEPEFPGLPASANLICKAADLLAQFAQQQTLSDRLTPVKIRLTKRLPMGGGLGGGSSDAATTLLALNHLWKLNIPLTQLANMGAKLGADIPVFVHGHTAYAEGTGDLLKPCVIPEHWFLILDPNCEVSTAEVFSHKLLTRDTPKSKITPALEGDLGRLGLGHAAADNDCEALVCKMYPRINEAKTWLNQYSQARLTGTGACVFACFTKKERADHVLSQMPAIYKGFVARGINRSPVFDALRSGRYRQQPAQASVKASWGVAKR